MKIIIIIIIGILFSFNGKEVITICFLYFQYFLLRSRTDLIKELVFYLKF